MDSSISTFLVFDVVRTLEALRGLIRRGCQFDEVG